MAHGRCLPTARASRTGRSPRWSGCAPGSPRTRRRDRPREAGATVVTHRARRARAPARRAAPATCSGLEERAAPDRPTSSGAGGCSSSGWPRAAGRPGLRGPPVGRLRLLEFIDYLLEWSAGPPIFVLTLARPELRERARRGKPHDARLVRLDRLADDGDRRDPRGSGAGHPRRAVATGSAAGRGRARCTRSRPSGCSSTAGCLPQDGARYVVAGDIGELDVPETLHALVAARLDGLDPAERALSRTPPCPARLHGRRAGRARRPRRRPRSRPVWRPRRRAGARARRRPALHGARAVRVPAGAGAHRRLRDARAARAQGAAPRAARPPARSPASRRDRRGARLPELAAAGPPEADDAPALRASGASTLAERASGPSLALAPRRAVTFEQAAELAQEPHGSARVCSPARVEAQQTATPLRPGDPIEHRPPFELLEQTGHRARGRPLKVQVVAVDKPQPRRRQGLPSSAGRASSPYFPESQTRPVAHVGA